MKKYRVTDEDGNALTVEELETVDGFEEEEGFEEIHDDDGLTPEEITALKGLAAVADKLMNLIANKVGDEEEEEEEIVTDDDEMEEEEITTDDDDVEEEIIDTDENTVEEEIVRKTSDSKKGFGSIERKKNVGDSKVNHELEVNQAWQKRYGGN